MDSKPQITRRKKDENEFYTICLVLSFVNTLV